VKKGCEGEEPMTERPERRNNPRLRLSYPIRVDAAAEEAEPGGETLGRTVTQNLGSRGAYFSTFHPDPYAVGQEVAVVLTVPHRLSKNGESVMLDMRGRGRVVRVESPQKHGRYGEDGLTISGVALEFSSPLSFHFRWI
jgi:hypothetical protein